MLTHKEYGTKGPPGRCKDAHLKEKKDITTKDPELWVY